MFDLFSFISSFKESLCQKCPKADLKYLSDLTPSDIKEWGIIKTEEETLKKKQQKLLQEMEILESKKKIIKGKIKLKIGNFTSKIAIKDGKVYKVDCEAEKCNPPFDEFPGAGL